MNHTASPSTTHAPQRTWKQKLLMRMAYGLVRLFHLTYRFETIGTDTIARYEHEHPDGLYAVACWHENLLAGTLSQVGRRLCLLISPSFDGDLIAYVAERFGFTTARGSSSRGGTGAIKSYVRLSRQRWHVAITVDGPKGPRHEVKSGIAQIASMVGAPIIPLAAIADRSWILHKSWDRFRIPKPFSTIRIYYGDPIAVPQQLEINSPELGHILAKVQASLVDIENRATVAGNRRQ